jgi:hypothetical protein
MRTSFKAAISGAIALALMAFSASDACARKGCRCGAGNTRTDAQNYYYDYPYTYANGYRVDPYWSYTSTRVPWGYQGDGSYYGLGFSGWKGETHGSYWYW